MAWSGRASALVQAIESGSPAAVRDALARRPSMHPAAHRGRTPWVVALMRLAWGGPSERPYPHNASHTAAHWRRRNDVLEQVWAKTPQPLGEVWVPPEDWPDRGAKREDTGPLPLATGLLRYAPKHGKLAQVYDTWMHALVAPGVGWSLLPTGSVAPAMDPREQCLRTLWRSQHAEDWDRWKPWMEALAWDQWQRPTVAPFWQELRGDMGWGQRQGEHVAFEGSPSLAHVGLACLATLPSGVVPANNGLLQAHPLYRWWQEHHPRWDLTHRVTVRPTPEAVPIEVDALGYARACQDVWDGHALAIVAQLTERAAERSAQALEDAMASVPEAPSVPRRSRL